MQHYDQRSFRDSHQQSEQKSRDIPQCTMVAPMNPANPEQTRMPDGRRPPEAVVALSTLSGVWYQQYCAPGCSIIIEDGGNERHGLPLDEVGLSEKLKRGRLRDQKLHEQCQRNGIGRA